MAIGFLEGRIALVSRRHVFEEGIVLPVLAADRSEWYGDRRSRGFGIVPEGSPKIIDR